MSEFPLCVCLWEQSWRRALTLPLRLTWTYLNFHESPYLCLPSAGIYRHMSLGPALPFKCVFVCVLETQILKSWQTPTCLLFPLEFVNEELPRKLRMEPRDYRAWSTGPNSSTKTETTKTSQSHSSKRQMGCAAFPKLSCQSPLSISPHQLIPPPHRIPGEKPQNTVKLSALRVFQDSIKSPPEKIRHHKQGTLRPDVRVEVQRVYPKLGGQGEDS